MYYNHYSELLSGTPNYIAPEVLKEEKVGLKIDNFALGVVIYFMSTCNNSGSQACSPSTIDPSQASSPTPSQDDTATPRKDQSRPSLKTSSTVYSKTDLPTESLSKKLLNIPGLTYSNNPDRSSEESTFALVLPNSEPFYILYFSYHLITRHEYRSRTPTGTHTRPNNDQKLVWYSKIY